ncbi:MAG: hypothetical protein KDI13_11465, partial [Alphaproteobacteria bacterium]|nr:hypothetical protein [Alphaproteobacteria bacterium]
GANGNLDLTVTDETRALSIQTPTKGTNFDITFAPGGESAQILSTSRNNAFSIDLNAEGTDALRSTLRETAIAENLRKIGELKNALKDSKVWAHLYKGGKIAGAGLLINGGALLLTREAMAKELEIADRLNKLPENHPMHLSDEAKADYLQMLDDVKLAREIDAGNPLPLAGAVSTTVATEATIMQKQAEFSQKHPGLSPELTSTLFISVVPTYGLRAEMEVYAMEALPSDPATAAPVLRPLIEANNAETIAEKNLDDANKAYNRFVFTTRGDPNPWLPPEDSYEQRLPAEQAKLDNARLAHEQAKIMRMDTFQKTMKSPEGMKQLTALMDKNQLLSLTQGARYQNHGSTSPEISAYLSAYKAAERENPTIQGSAMEYIAQKATDSLVTGFSGGMIERNEASIFGTAGEYIHDKAVDLVTTSDKEAAEQSARKVLFDNPEKMQEFVTSTFSSPLAQDAAAQAEAKAEAAPYTPVDTYVTLSNGEAVDLEQLKRIESMPEYNYMAIPLANMRDGWENDPIEIRDLHDTRNADATPKEAKDLIEARFTAQMEEIRAKELEARQEAERRLQEELERKRYLAQMNAQTNTPNNTTSPLGAPGMQAKAGMALSP